MLIWLQFSALVRNEMVQSLSCYYEPKRRQFYSVIELGSDICGYKRIVHGGFRLRWRQQMQEHVVLVSAAIHADASTSFRSSGWMSLDF